MQKTPRYYEVFQEIKNDIVKKKYTHGDKLPDEKEIMGYFNVSDIEVHRAFIELINRGFVKSKDLTVCDHHEAFKERIPGEINSFFVEVEDQGHKASSIEHGKDLTLSDEILKKEMNLKNDELIIKVDRTRLIDEKPVGFQTNYIPYRLCPEFINESIEKQSLQLLLTGKYKFSIVRALEKVEAEVSNSVVAKLLKVEEGTPILKIERKAFLEDNTIGVYAILRFKGDSYKYSNLIKTNTD